MTAMYPLFRAFEATITVLKKMAGNAPDVVRKEQKRITHAREVLHRPVETWGDLFLWTSAWYELHVRHTKTIAMKNIRFSGAPELGLYQLQCSDAAMRLWAWFRVEIVPPMIAMDEQVVDSLENIREVRP